MLWLMVRLEPSAGHWYKLSWEASLCRVMFGFLAFSDQLLPSGVDSWVSSAFGSAFGEKVAVGEDTRRLLQLPNCLNTSPQTWVPRHSPGPVFSPSFPHPCPFWCPFESLRQPLAVFPGHSCPPTDPSTHCSHCLRDPLSWLVPSFSSSSPYLPDALFHCGNIPPGIAASPVALDTPQSSIPLLREPQSTVYFSPQGCRDPCFCFWGSHVATLRAYF